MITRPCWLIWLKIITGTGDDTLKSNHSGPWRRGVRSSVWHVPGKIPGYRLVAKSNHFYLPQALGEFLIVVVEDLTYDDVTGITSFAKHSNSLNGKGKLYHWKRNWKPTIWKSLILLSPLKWRLGSFLAKKTWFWGWYQ